MSLALMDMRLSISPGDSHRSMRYFGVKSLIPLRERPFQIHQHYFRRPRELDERLKRAGGHRRLPDSVYNFINYLFSDGEMRRRKNGHNLDSDWRLVISLTDLAYLLRMTSRIKHGKRGRVMKEFDKIATMAVEIDLLKTYDLRDEESLVFELNPGVAFPAMDDHVNPEALTNTFPPPCTAVYLRL